MLEKVFIHHTSEVSKEAKIGENTKIWNNSHIREGVIIGTNCMLGKNTYIDKNVIIGNSVIIQNGVSVYDGVTISDDVFIGPNVVFTNDKYPRAFVEDYEKRFTHVKLGAFIGGNTVIVCGNTIGEYSMIGAGSVITKDIHKYALAVGNPAKIVGFICPCGKKLKKYRIQNTAVMSVCEKCDKKTIMNHY